MPEIKRGWGAIYLGGEARENGMIQKSFKDSCARICSTLPMAVEGHPC